MTGLHAGAGVDRLLRELGGAVRRVSAPPPQPLLNLTNTRRSFIIPSMLFYKKDAMSHDGQTP